MSAGMTFSVTSPALTQITQSSVLPSRMTAVTGYLVLSFFRSSGSDTFGSAVMSANSSEGGSAGITGQM